MAGGVAGWAKEEGANMETAATAADRTAERIRWGMGGAFERMGRQSGLN